MTKKLFIPSERYAAPEMKVVELNLNGSLMQIITGSFGDPGRAGSDPEDEYYDTI